MYYSPPYYVFMLLLRRVMAALDPVKVIVQNLTAADVRSYNTIDCCMCIICICIRVSVSLCVNMPVRLLLYCSIIMVHCKFCELKKIAIYLNILLCCCVVCSVYCCAAVSCALYTAVLLCHVLCILLCCCVMCSVYCCAAVSCALYTAVLLCHVLCILLYCCVMYSVQAMELEVPNIPHLPDRGTHKVYFDPTDLYIDASDFREVRVCIML